MMELRDVDINWKMLTVVRPKKKHDEEFFAQWDIIFFSIFIMSLVGDVGATYERH